MTKAEALHAFFAWFGLRAYEENNVPDRLADGSENAPPYITYEYVSDSWDSTGESFPVAVNLWDRSGSRQYLDELTDAIAQAVGRYKRLDCDSGCIIITKGAPFAQAAPSGFDPDDKRVLINLNLTFITRG